MSHTCSRTQGACLLNEKIDPLSFFFAVLSFGGLICIVRPGFIFGYKHATSETDGSWLAIGSALLGAIGQAFVFITVRKLQGVKALVIVHYFMLFSIVMSLLYIVVVQRVRASVCPSSSMFVCWLLAVSTNYGLCSSLVGVRDSRHVVALGVCDRQRSIHVLGSNVPHEGLPAREGGHRVGHAVPGRRVRVHLGLAAA